MTFHAELEKLRKEQKDKTEEVKVEAKVEEVEEVVEEVKVEKKEEKKEEVSENAAFARMRLEAAEAKREAERYKKEVEELKKPKEVKEVKEDVEPNRAEDPEAWLLWRQSKLDKETQELKSWKEQKEKEAQEAKQKSEEENLYKAAENEFVKYEQAYKAKTPDYEQAATHMISALAYGFKVHDPNMSNEDLEKNVKKRVLMYAARAVQEGKDPAQYLYEMAGKQFGYVKAEPKVEEKKEEPKVDLKAIEKNKKKSASGHAAGGQGGNQNPSLESLGNMSMAEFSRLSPQQRQELKDQARRAG